MTLLSMTKLFENRQLDEEIDRDSYSFLSDAQILRTYPLEQIRVV